MIYGRRKDGRNLAQERRESIKLGEKKTGRQTEVASSKAEIVLKRGTKRTEIKPWQQQT